MSTTPTIGVGWSLYEKAPADSDYWPRGGVVVDISSVADPESGEVSDQYVLVRAHRGGLVWASLRAAEVTTPSGPNAHTIRGISQVAARQLAAPKRRPDDRRDLELFSLGARLMSVIA